MTQLHLMKLCVGIDTHNDLLAYEKSRESVYYIHTRNRPVRADEIISQGSLYWVIKGQIICRRVIVDMKTTMLEGRPMTYIGLDKRPIATFPQPRRAFQGWRYLKDEDAPRDRDEGPDNLQDSLTDDLPEHLRRELAEKGLL